MLDVTYIRLHNAADGRVVSWHLMSYFERSSLWRE